MTDRRSPPWLIAIGGYSGSGKSTLARALAARLGVEALSSDIIRKRLFGADPTTRLGPEAYRPEVSQRVYAAQRSEAEAAIRAGRGVIVEAVFDRDDERAAIERVARDAGVPFAGLWLDLPAEIATARIAARVGDASDATAEVHHAQRARGAGDVGWTRIGSEDREAVFRAALAAIGKHGMPSG